MVKRLLIIPARGGSKRIKNKNIKLFHGKPIIYYSLQTAIKSKLFKKIHVSTDSIKIINIVKKYGFEVDFRRPKHLARDKSLSEDVIRYVYKKFEKKKDYFQEIWCLNACAPLLHYKHLVKASKLIKNKNKIVLPVTEYSQPIQWAFKFRNNKLIPLKTGNYKIRSQDLIKYYFDSGDFVGIPTKLLRKRNLKFDKNYIGYIVPKYSSVDIDDINDWKFAEKLYHLKKKL